MIVRVRAKAGTQRFTVEPSDDVAKLVHMLVEKFPIHDPSSISITTETDPKTAVHVDQLLGNHGDLIYMYYDDKVHTQKPSSQAPQISSSSSATVDAIPDVPEVAQVVEDPVDLYLEKQEGLIRRERDPKLCKHTANGMCNHCIPLEPYDVNYLEQNKIKHMSFHAYIRQINASQQNRAAANPGAKILPPLEEPEYKVKTHCSGGHAPWPEGICTKCQPSAITLQSQSFRMVDHIEFSSPSLVDNFIHYWRLTGEQRFGYLFGRYEPYAEVPLGIKAVVEVIFEPPQTGASDGVTVEFPWNDEMRVSQMAELCGLRLVGMAWTDLVDDGTGRGKVVTKRHVDSFFLSSLEANFCGKMQHRYPSPTKFSSTGKFGSKFVTCVITGNIDGDIDVTGWQVSNTCMGMVEASIIEPSIDPSVMRTLESSGTLYVPEVFYKYKNKYGVNVQESAKPTFPVEYLLVNLTHGFPQQSNPLFTNSPSFTIENRPLEKQTVASLSKLTSASSSDLATQLSDFHLLCYIQSTGVLSKDELRLLAGAATSKTTEPIEQLKASSGWETLMTVLRESGGDQSSMPSEPMSRGTSSASEPKEDVLVNYPESFNHQSANVNGIRLHYVDEGPKDGEPLLLIHGFPDLWYGWRYQIPFLAYKGYRVIVPDSRGYGQTSAPHVPPHDLSLYGYKNLCKDMVDLLDVLEIPKVTLIGHDWGGMYVWRMALYYPDRVKAIASYCTPYIPPNPVYLDIDETIKRLPSLAYQKYFATTEAELEFDSDPYLFFKLIHRTSKADDRISKSGGDRPRSMPSFPVLPALANVEVPRSKLLSEKELQYYADQYLQRGFNGGLNYYKTRKVNYDDELALTEHKIKVPCMMVTAGNDIALRPEMAKGMGKFIPDLTMRHVEDSGHWILVEEKELANQYLGEFLEDLKKKLVHRSSKM
ncbi:hypothetical protein BZG36_04774 [Bifiguratus adelaidae]|uniref:Nuclear protein localization protein 4 n=1 Tax=Bifiguratus adelaidae TaxID=1938954 RepID=A0A261XWB9_9FUNG|nr:hypothetical protein BZG36_04774 [Bifiguratus adelaidae]